jgi:hypothetical protein
MKNSNNQGKKLSNAKYSHEEYTGKSEPNEVFYLTNPKGTALVAVFEVNGPDNVLVSAVFSMTKYLYHSNFTKAEARQLYRGLVDDGWVSTPPNNTDKRLSHHYCYTCTL